MVGAVGIELRPLPWEGNALRRSPINTGCARRVRPGLTRFVPEFPGLNRGGSFTTAPSRNTRCFRLCAGARRAGRRQVAFQTVKLSMASGGKNSFCNASGPQVCSKARKLASGPVMRSCWGTADCIRRACTEHRARALSALAALRSRDPLHGTPPARELRAYDQGHLRSAVKCRTARGPKQCQRSP